MSKTLNLLACLVAPEKMYTTYGLAGLLLALVFWSALTGISIYNLIGMVI